MTDNTALKRFAFFFVLGILMWAFWWAQRADERRRSRGFAEAARALGLELVQEEADYAPMDYPTRSLGRYRNVFRGSWRGQDVVTFDEIIQGTKSREVHTVVGFRASTSQSRNLFSFLRLWQVAEHGGWTWVYRRFSAVSPKKLETYIERCYEKAFAA